ncbi:MAG: hypothetical protein ACAH59_02455 [Pseudobdellovibrionaceae bacterium]
MKKVILAGIATATATACIQTMKNPSENSPDRNLSSLERNGIPTLEDESPRLVYVTYKKDGKNQTEAITPERWNGTESGFSEGGREDYLKKFFFAHSREKSAKGLRHAACFEGAANRVGELFFSKDSAAQIRNVRQGWVETKASSDGRLLGVQFDHAELGLVSFRMNHCHSGKSSVSENVKVSRAIAVQETKDPDNFVPKVKVARDQFYGFQMLDAHSDRNLPKFSLRADYEQANHQPEERPWKGLNLRDKKQALKFALMAQKYFYENMANQNAKNPDANFIAANNKSRYWCHVPWLNVGTAGREAVHGLTQERDLKPSKQIPHFQNATPGSDWGVAYFNAPGCRTLNSVFGSVTQPKETPEWQKSQFANGTFIAKILFTTANFPEIQGAYTWKANVSEPGSPERSIQSVRHIQMDIAVRDSDLGGVSADLNHWAMIGFYYDPNYDFETELKDLLGEENPLKQIKNLPKELMKMRPIGVQSGFDDPSTLDTIVFPGAFANGAGTKERGYRLNGPADNPRSSCLGCHGTAGTSASSVPGFLSEKQFLPFKGKIVLDFNQQVALAKANFETEMK